LNILKSGLFALMNANCILLSLVSLATWGLFTGETRPAESVDLVTEDQKEDGAMNNSYPFCYTPE